MALHFYGVVVETPFMLVLFSPALLQMCAAYLGIAIALFHFSDL